MKKKVIIPIFMLACVFFLTGCSKVSLAGNTDTNNQNGAPTDMGTPPDGGTPPEDMGTPPEGVPNDRPSN